MKYLYFVLVAVVLIARVWVGRRRRRRKLGAGSAEPGMGTVPVSRVDPDRAKSTRRASIWTSLEGALGAVGMVATREIKERVRGRIFRIGTLIILIVVSAAIVVPTLHSPTGPTTQTVGIVGGLSPSVKQVVQAAGKSNSDVVKFVSEPSLAAARKDLRSGDVDLTVVDANQVLLNRPAASSNSPADPGLVQAVAQYLGVLKAYRTAGLTEDQATQINESRSVPVHTLQPGSKSTSQATSAVGLVLLFFMLTQYNTWILIGVMQEKSSRVVEVLLATLRPIQLLGGKVLGIGLVALAQATLIVGFALIVGTAVGSDLLRGAAPLALGSELLWLVLGYAFYCWVYAAAGSTAERQDQVQTLALPLSIPILLGYIFSITVVSSGHPDFFFKVLAYLPPTAPFCMSALVGLSQVTWWEFTASVLITIAGTAATAVFAARVYSRAVLRTGARVRVRELFTGAAGR